MKDELAKAPLDLTEVITTRGLRKSFGEIAAVDGIDLSVNRGEIFGLVGPDGAGKTTTMRMLCGILDASGGKADVLGCDVLGNPEAVKPRIGYMPQRFSLYQDLTVAENLYFFANLYHVAKPDRIKREAQLLHASRMEPFRDRLAGNLSGGMKQKLALACTLIHAPEILLLDEPTTGVDPVSRRDFWEILYDLLKDGATLFVSTPYMDEAERCNRIAFLDNGKILECDSPENLKKRLPGDLFEVIVEQQEQAIAILSGRPSISGIQVFGDRLHVWIVNPSIRKKNLRETLEGQGLANVQIRRISPGLEDVFISFLDHPSPTGSGGSGFGWPSRPVTPVPSSPDVPDRPGKTP